MSGASNRAGEAPSPLAGRLILVTGASGFIGGHLCLSLHGLGCRVRACARGAPPDRLRNLVEWRQVDVARESEWAALEGVEFVVHLAGLAHQIGVVSESRNQEFHRVNVEGTRALAEAAARSKTLRRFLFVSSVAAVGSFSRVPIDDDTPPMPRDDYGRSKLRAERELKRAFEGRTSVWCVLRPPLVYGPGNPGNMERLQRLIAKGVPLPFAGIRNRRSFLFVGNLTDAIAHCLIRPEAGGRTFLVADREIVSTPELIRILSSCSGRRVALFPVPLALLRVAGRLGDLVARVGGRSLGIDSYSVARLSGSMAINCSGIHDIGWTPPHSLRGGLAMTLTPAWPPGPASS